MPRGDNLTREDRARGGRNSHGGGRGRSSGQKGGRSSSKRNGFSAVLESAKEKVSSLGD